MKQAEDQLILGLTASPGGSEERIEDVMRNLFIDRVEARTESDEDVMPYVEETKVQTIRVTLPPAYVQIAETLKQLYAEKLAKLRKFGFLRFKGVTKKMLLQSRVEIVVQMKSSKRRMYLFGALLVQSQAVMILHATELIETQGAFTLDRYLTKLREDPEQKRAGKALLKDERWVEVEAKARDLVAVEHPKMEKLRSLIGEQMSGKPGSRIIVFTQYRDTIEPVMSLIARSWGRHGREVRRPGERGAARDKGLKQREQAEVLGRFRDGAFNVLVSSSIGEEGLHVPDVDLVVFYEAVPSEIRSIQRRGRTGRTMPGRVVVLLAEGTIDEAYFRTTANKERKMKSLIEGEREKGAERASRTRGQGERRRRRTSGLQAIPSEGQPLPPERDRRCLLGRPEDQRGRLLRRGLRQRAGSAWPKDRIADEHDLRGRATCSTEESASRRPCRMCGGRQGRDPNLFAAFVRCTGSAPTNTPAGMCAAVVQRLHEQGCIWRAFWRLMPRYSEERKSLLFTRSSIETLRNAFPAPVDSLPLPLYTQVADPARLAEDVAKWLQESFKCGDHLSSALAGSYLTKPNSFPARLTGRGVDTTRSLWGRPHAAPERRVRLRIRLPRPVRRLGHVDPDREDGRVRAGRRAGLGGELRQGQRRRDAPP